MWDQNDQEQLKSPHPASMPPPALPSDWQSVWIDHLFLPATADGPDLQALLQQALKRMELGKNMHGPWGIARQAIDTRKKPPRWAFRIWMYLPEALASKALLQNGVSKVTPPKTLCIPTYTPSDKLPPVVVGAGPAGLLAAWTLAEAGWAPWVLERGQEVKSRARTVSALYRHGTLNTESNVCFGEGGAGTFSDGKLYTRVNDPRIRKILKLLVAFGAKPQILTDARPHLGTDRLVKILLEMRRQLEARGVRFRFDTRVDDLVVDGPSNKRALCGLRLASGEVLPTRHCIVATGHSAHEVWPMLERHGAKLEARPFAIGFRVEHPQTHIDALQYGADGAEIGLPAAEYRLAYDPKAQSKPSRRAPQSQRRRFGRKPPQSNPKNPPHSLADPDGRSVYSFCMCPGGVVVTTPTSDGALCINGMSHAARSGRFANSAIVTSITPEDWQAWGLDPLWGGVLLQRKLEREAFTMGGGAFCAPAARLSDFIDGKVSASLPKTSYRRGVVAAPLHKLLPPTLHTALCEGLLNFGRKIPGWATSEAQVLGIETRTASPIRIRRNENHEIPNIQGVYPAGEGMGFGGGIISAAKDGMATAEALLRNAVSCTDTQEDLEQCSSQTL